MSECIDHGKQGNARGYASVRHEGQWSMRHRVAYCQHHDLALLNIKDKVIRHKCDNPRCVNPQHLEIGSQADNMQDCVERGRHANNLSNFDQTENRRRGETQVLARWTDDDIRAMRAAVAGGETQVSVAKRYGCRQSDISRIVRRQAWSHVT